MEGAERWHWVRRARHGTAGEVGGPCAATSIEREHARVGDARVRKKRERKSARARTRGEKTREREREKRESDESDNAVEGSEEYFDESEHVDGFGVKNTSTRASM